MTLTRLEELREKYDPKEEDLPLDPTPWKWTCTECMPIGSHQYREAFVHVTQAEVDEENSGWEWLPQEGYAQERATYENVFNA